MKKYKTKHMNLQLFEEESNKKEPIIKTTDKYFDVIGHFDDELLCAKMTLLADLYAVEKDNGYARFKIEDKDKINLVNDKLLFPPSMSIYVDNTFITTFITGSASFNITNDGLWMNSEGDADYYIWNAPTNSRFLGFSTTQGATIPDSEYAVGQQNLMFDTTMYLYSTYETGYTSTINLTNCTCNKVNETGLDGEYSAEISANEGYYLSSVTSTLGTVTVLENKKTATITISNVTEDFTITGVGTAKTVKNVVLHPNENGVTDYTTDILPKTAVDLSSVVKKDGSNAQQTVSLTSGTGTTAFGVKSMSGSSYISFSGTGGWLGSYGVSSTKQPTFYNGTSHNIAYEENSVYFVQGSSSQAGNGTSGSYLSTKWEGTIENITTPTNGMKIVYRIATNTGVSTAGAVLSINGGTNYYPVVYNVNSVIGTRYSVGSNIVLTFNSTQTATAYLTSNTSSTITGCWQIMDYDANSYAYLRMYNLNTTNGDRDLVMRYDTGSITAGSYDTKYGAITSAVTLKANPSTGQLKAVKFTENGTDLVNKYESLSNKVTSISSSSTDTQYPSAKLLYDQLLLKQDKLPTIVNDRYLHTNSSTGNLEWSQLSVPNVVQDLTTNTAGTLDSTAWETLKSTHTATIASPTMTGLDSSYEFVNIKLSVNSINQFVKLAKNTTNKYSGLFFIEESTNLYEVTAYYNGTNIILRCATVY